MNYKNKITLINFIQIHQIDFFIADLPIVRYISNSYDRSGDFIVDLPIVRDISNSYDRLGDFIVDHCIYRNGYGIFGQNLKYFDIEE